MQAASTPESARRIPCAIVIDADAQSRRTIADALREAGFDVREQDGVDAVRTAEAFHPDVIVMDLCLPRPRDGLAVAGELRDKFDVAIVCATAADTLAERLAAFDTGVDDFVSKPLHLAELIARVRAVLRRSGRVGV